MTVVLKEQAPAPNVELSFSKAGVSGTLLYHGELFFTLWSDLHLLIISYAVYSHDSIHVWCHHTAEELCKLMSEAPLNYTTS